jgi:hypothetical protein
MEIDELLEKQFQIVISKKLNEIQRNFVAKTQFNESR